MKKLFKKFVCLAAMALAVFTTFAVAGCSKKDKNVIAIGMSGPLTGGASLYGLAVQYSAQMAVDEINAAGVFGGYELKLYAFDDKHDASLVANNYANMVKKGVQASIGCVTSDPCVEFANLSKEGNMFFITPSATADSVVKEDNAYQMCFSDLSQGIYAARYVNENVPKTTKIGILYVTGDVYSTGIRNNFMANLDSEYDVVEAQFTEQENASWDSQVQTLKDCEFIFLPIYYTPASSFMNAAKDQVAANAVYFGCDGLDGIDNIQGFDINTIPQEISFLSHFNSSSTSGPSKEFIDKFNAKYNSQYLNQFGASAYDCVYAIYGAMKQAYEAGKNVSPATTAAEMNKILKEVFQGGYTFNGVTGTNVTWGTDGKVQKDAIKFVVKEANQA